MFVSGKESMQLAKMRGGMCPSKGYLQKKCVEEASVRTNFPMVPRHKELVQELYEGNIEFSRRFTVIDLSLMKEIQTYGCHLLLHTNCQLQIIAFLLEKNVGPAFSPVSAPAVDFQ